MPRITSHEIRERRRREKREAYEDAVRSGRVKVRRASKRQMRQWEREREERKAKR